jgi:hypothetical protein
MSFLKNIEEIRARARLGFKDEVHGVPGGSTRVFKLGGAGS